MLFARFKSDCSRDGAYGPRQVGSMRRKCDLGRAARAGRNREAETVQLDDRSDQAQTKSEALGIAAFVRAIEAPHDRFAFRLGDAGAGILHPDNALAVAAQQRQCHASALGSEFHGIVDQIGDGLKKEITVTMDGRLIGGLGLKGDMLVLGDRLIEVANLAHQRGELNLAKSFEAAVMLDLGNAQQGSEDGQRLVETANLLVDNRA